MAIFTFGEGYHNYHHSFQHDYRNGVKKWQWDPTKWSIWTLEKLGLASELRRVPEEKILLAEMRETRRQAELRLAKIEAAKAERAGDPCPRWRGAVEAAHEMTEKFARNYSELEDAVAEGVRVSKKNLARWKAEAAEYLEQLSAMDQFAPAAA